MQLFINNWATMLTAPAGASAGTFSVPLADAAKLTGLGAGDHYLLTLAEVDGNGLETAWETVKVTASAAGVLTALRDQEGTTARDWAAGSVISARVTKGTLEALQSSSGSGTAVGDAAPQPLGTASPGAAAAASREDHVHAKPTAADIGAATAAQGAKADMAVQPAALTSGLAGKVDKDGAKGLSDENYTAAEKAKLAGLEAAHFKGLHASLAALQTAHPSAVAGDYADVDSGTGADVARYIWDVSDSKWVIQSGASGSMTAAQIKTAYESNPDTNGYSDAEKAKLGVIAAGATANATDAQLRDRSLHTGTQAASTINDFAATVRATVLTGLSLASGAAIAATDSALVAWGKLQKQINDLVTAVAGKQETLVSTTNIKTVNGASLLGAGNLAVASLPVVQTFTGAKTLGLADINTYNVSQDATAQPVTLPAQATVAWTDDAEIHIEQGAAGAVTITGAAGVTINGVVAPSILLFAKGAVASLKRKGSNNWTLVGAIGTAEDQRAALGIVLTTSSTDTTADRVLTTGYMGLGKLTAPPTPADVNSTSLPTGLYRISTTDAAQRPPGSVNTGVMLVERFSAVVIRQTWGEAFTSAGVRRMWYRTSYATDTWDDWQELWTSYGTNVITVDTGAFGHATGSGGTATQATSKSTGVTLNKPSGQVTMNAAALAANTAVSFTLTNSKIAANDLPRVVIKSGATAGAYVVQVDAVAAGSCRISVRNMTGGSLSEALVLQFNNEKGATA